MIASPQRREEIIDALRRGTVPRSSLDAFAVGLERFEGAIDEDLRKVGAGGSVFKAVRGEYGCGKTFFARWLADRARKLGFATSEVQVSETETPLHRLETVYRRLMERLSTADTPQGALRNVVDGWFYALEEDVLAEGTVGPRQPAGPGTTHRRTAGAAAGQGHQHGPDVQCGPARLPGSPGRGATSQPPKGSWPGWRASRTWQRLRNARPGSRATSTTSAP